MSDLLAALGLALVIEAIAYLAFPRAMQRAIAEIARMDPTLIRRGALIAAGAGLFLVWLARG